MVQNISGLIPVAAAARNRKRASRARHRRRSITLGCCKLFHPDYSSMERQEKTETGRCVKNISEKACMPPGRVVHIGDRKPVRGAHQGHELRQGPRRRVWGVWNGLLCPSNTGDGRIPSCGRLCPVFRYPCSHSSGRRGCCDMRSSETVAGLRNADRHTEAVWKGRLMNPDIDSPARLLI